MSHVDEGHLHAWLDGALDHYPPDEAEAVRQHMATCERCAARLEEARALRAESRGILAGADPGPGPLPELEEMRAEARRRGQDRGRRSSLRRLAWAASVVLALGAGWMANEVARPGGLTSPPVPARGPGPVVRPASDDAEAAAGSRAAEEPAVPPRQDEGAAGLERPTGAPSSEPRTTEVAQAPDPGSDAAMPGDSGAVSEAAVTEEDATLAARLAPGAPDSGLEPPAAELRGDSAGEDAARRAELEAPAPDRTTAAEREAVADRAAGAPAAAVGELAAPAGGGLPLGVPGLPVIAASRSHAGSGGTLVRVLQRFPEGDTLEVMHLLGGADPGSLPALDPSRTEVTVPASDGWLVLRARRGGAFLRELAERLRP